MIRSGLAKVALAALLALAAGAGGCATAETANDRVNPENPTWYSRPSGAMHVIVHRVLTAPSRTVGEDYERGRAEIGVARIRLAAREAHLARVILEVGSAEHQHHARLGREAERHDHGGGLRLARLSNHQPSAGKPSGRHGCG